MYQYWTGYISDTNAFPLFVCTGLFNPIIRGPRYIPRPCYPTSIWKSETNLLHVSISSYVSEIYASVDIKLDLTGRFQLYINIKFYIRITNVFIGTVVKPIHVQNMFLVNYFFAFSLYGS